MLSRPNHCVARIAAVTLLWILTVAVAWPVTAQHADCAPATAEAYLEINNVRARVFGNGPLAWRGSPQAYEVPKGGGISAILTQVFLIGGLVNGELRVSAARYGNYEFWPGPLDETTALPPGACAIYDRIWKISRSDVANYEKGMQATIDLKEWPTGLGAPTADADGNEIDVMREPLSQRAARTIDLAAGERPLFSGDQMLWWVMNDAGNVHLRSETAPISIEVHGTAFAFDLPGPANETTFYRYRIFYRGPGRFAAAYVGIYQDPDLGAFDDDYVGTDTTLGLAFVYNSNNDDGPAGYGEAPPAAGVQFVRGPTVPAPADTALLGNARLPGFRNLRMTSMLNHNGSPRGPLGPPGVGSEFYEVLQGRWTDGSPVTTGGFGDNPNGQVTTFVYPGDPVTGMFWSELNRDGLGTVNPISDRRFTAASGPFSMATGEWQEVIVAVLWARGSSNLSSIVELRRAARAMQDFADTNFADQQLSLPAPVVVATPYNGSVVLAWSGVLPEGGRLESFSRYLSSLSATYKFEGYDVFQYESVFDTVGVRKATYDTPNGITRIVDAPPYDQTVLAAHGTDAGIEHVYHAAGLTNYRTYCFGVQAYAVQDEYYPRVGRSPVARVCAEPRETEILSDYPEAARGGRDGTAPDTVYASRVDGRTTDAVWAIAVNPAAVTGETYFVNFVDRPCGAGEPTSVPCVAFEVARVDGSIILPALRSRPPFYGERLFYNDGLEFSIVPPPSSNDTTAVFRPGESYAIATSSVAPRRRNALEAAAALDLIGIVPNPYYGLSDYAVTKGDHEVRLTNLLPGSTVRVFTLSGTLVKTLVLEPDNVLKWDLRNKAGKVLANGMYLIHVEVPGVGSRVLKFSLVRSKLR